MNDRKVRTRVRPTNPCPYSPEHTRRITEEAQAWTVYASCRSSLPPAQLYRKALESVAFTLSAGARTFAVPSKLAGTRDHQQELRSLNEQDLPVGHRLTAMADEDHIAISHERTLLGYVQRRHVPWLCSLLSCGASVYLLDVTGTDSPEKYLGLNVCFAHLALAIERQKYGENGAAGDGRTGDVPDPDEDIRLWRAQDGSARANVFHVVRHSPTGFNWGYRGSGPADLARSILLRFVGPAQADLLYQQFKDDVVSTIPYEGGLIEAAFIRSWLSQCKNEL